MKTEAGKAVPLDPIPIEEGNIIIRSGPQLGQVVAHYEKKEETQARLKCTIPAGRTAYLSHFATCPDARKWRKGKSKCSE